MGRMKSFEGLASDGGRDFDSMDVDWFSRVCLVLGFEDRVFAIFKIQGLGRAGESRDNNHKYLELNMCDPEYVHLSLNGRLTLRRRVLNGDALARLVFWRYSVLWACG